MFRAVLSRAKNNSRLKERLLSFVLTFALLIGAVPSLVFVSRTVEPVYPAPINLQPAMDLSSSTTNNRAWYDGTVADGRYDGYADTLGSTQECPYIIKTGLELAELAAIVNAATGNDTFAGKFVCIEGSRRIGLSNTINNGNNVLDLIAACGVLYQSGADTVEWMSCNTGNVNYGWTPIGSSATNCFRGTIWTDENVQIYNLAGKYDSSWSTTAFGLFGFVGADANISDLHLKNTQLYATKANASVGAVAGIVSANATIANCSVSGLAAGNRSVWSDGETAVQTEPHSQPNDYYIVPDFVIGTTVTAGGLIGQITNGTVVVNTVQFGGKISAMGSKIGGLGGVIGTVSGGTVTVNGFTSPDGVHISSFTTSHSFQQAGGVVGYASERTGTLTILNVGTNADHPLNVLMTGKFNTTNGGDNKDGGMGGLVGISALSTLSIGAVNNDCYVSIQAHVSKATGDNNFNFGGVVGGIRASGRRVNIAYCHVSDSACRDVDEATTTSGNRVSLGGIIGTVEKDLVADSGIANCTVTNLSLSCNGMSGGIIGAGQSKGDGCVRSITDCTVTGLRIVQNYYNATSDTAFTLLGGVAAMTSADTVISGCTVEGEIAQIVAQNGISHNFVGGIVGRATGNSAANSRIENCRTDMDLRVMVASTNTANRSVLALGGICGYMKNIAVTGCVAVVRTNWDTLLRDGFDNDVEAGLTNPKILAQDNTTIGSATAGGIAGMVRGTSSVTNCLTGGDLDVRITDTSRVVGPHQSAVGGLVGVIYDNNASTISGNTSMMSLGGNLTDAVGGLIGFDNSTQAVVNNNYFGGSPLVPHAASVVAYSNTGTPATSYTGNAYDSKWSPCAASMDNRVTATTSATIPSRNTSYTAWSTEYYTAITGRSVTFTGDHVFAATGNAALNTVAFAYVENTGSSGSVSVLRRIRLVKNVLSAGNGTTTPFSVGANDWDELQSYVAAGGGFLGAQFIVTANGTSSVTAPIGMALNDDRRSADDNQPFCGTLNGNGHTVTLNTTRPDTTVYNGLFGYALHAKIESLDVSYTGAYAAKSSRYAGGLVGCLSFGVVNDVQVTATGGLTLAGEASGGLVGYARDTQLNTVADTFCTFTGALKGGTNTGGIVGKTANDNPAFTLSGKVANTDYIPENVGVTYSFTADTAMTRCSTAGDVSGSSSVGGLIGHMTGGQLTVSDSFMFGNVTGSSSNVGGLVGLLDTGAATVLQDVYMHGDVYAADRAGGLVGFITTPSSATPPASGITYFVGQIECDGTLGALTSGVAGVGNFCYDKQVAGNLPVCGNVEDALLNELTGQSMTVSQRTLLASGITTGNPSGNTYTPASGVTATFGTGWTYSNSGPADRFSHNNSSGVGAKYTKTGTGSNATFANAFVQISFTGTGFSMNAVFSGGGDAYDVFIDGNPVVFSGATQLQEFGKAGDLQLYQYLQSYTADGNNATVAFISDASHTTADYLIYASANNHASGNTGATIETNSVSTVLSIVGLDEGPHTVTIGGVRTRSSGNSYMNIKSFFMESSGTRYKPISAWENSVQFADRSMLSTQRLYHFVVSGEENQTVSAHNFFANAGVTEMGDPDNVTYACNKNATDLGVLGVSAATTNGVTTYTRSTLGAGGNFTLTSTREVDGYSLAIQEKILTPPLMGEGTAESPFLIRNVEELVNFRTFVNDVYGGAGLYFQLAMGDDPDFNTGRNLVDGRYIYDVTDENQNTTATWNTAIGKATQQFQGHFDGNGKVIYTVATGTINGSKKTVSGLFDYTAGATIENLTLEGIVTATARSSGAVGGLIANATGTTVRNCRVGTSQVVSVNGILDVHVGGVIGTTDGNATVSGVLANGNTAITNTAFSPTGTSEATSMGGLIGRVQASGNKQALTIENNIVYGELSAAQHFLMTGGLVGRYLSNGKTDLRGRFANNAVYGSMNAYAGYMGGILGTTLIFDSASTIEMTNNVITASLTGVGDAYTLIGGLIGYTNADAKTYLPSGNVFTGVVNGGVSTGRTSLFGGFVGNSVNGLQSSGSITGNYFDTTVNPGLSANGNGNAAWVNTNQQSSNGGRTRAELMASGVTLQPDLTGLTFGSAVNADTAQRIAAGQSVWLNLVRVDAVSAATTAEDRYPHLSSAFVLDEGVTLTVLDNDTTDAVLKTDSDYRVVSVAADTEHTLTVRAVHMVNNADAFGGYGKEVIYHPSVASVGKTDASYLAANPTGDGIGTASNSFTLYTADQVMGLDAVVRSSTADGFGNPVPTAATAGYTAYLARDISAAGVDYRTANTPADDATRTFAIGNAENPFEGTLNGQEHTLSGWQTTGSDAVALFAATSGATIQNIGMTDSVFALTGTSGTVGTFAALAENTAFDKSFSSARVEQGSTSPDGVYAGGFAGTVNGGSFADCFFTGSVGVTATMVNTVASYPVIGDGNGIYYSAGFAAAATGTVSVSDSYVASYIHGVATTAENPNRGIAYFVANGGDNVTLTDCALYNNAGAENCRALGDADAATTVLTVTAGFFPSKWTAHPLGEQAARVAVDFSSSAASMSNASVSAVGALFDANAYDNAPAVIFNTNGQSLFLGLGTDELTRDNSGMASVRLTLSADGATSSRMLIMNLQCWYDNFQTVNSQKVYTVKSAADLSELSQMVADGSDAHVGHTHREEHNEPGVASDRFAGAVIQLGANIAANGETLSLIGETAATAFAGTFEGNGFTIANANFENSGDVAGLFGYLAEDASVSGVMLTGQTTVTIQADATGTVYFGGAVARYTTGSVTDCANGAAITIDNLSAATVYAGGVIGEVAQGLTLTRCYNMGHLTVRQNGMYLGGIAGKNAGTVSKCYNTGMVEGFSLQTDYTPDTTLAGICAVNTGTVSACYNAAILRFAKENGLFAIADGTVSESYADGQIYTPEYAFREVEGGYPLSEGVTVLGTAAMSGATALSGTGWSADDWLYEEGYYPRFANIEENTAAVAATVSALATRLEHSEDTATFENFETITMKYGNTVTINSRAKENNVGTFSKTNPAGEYHYTVVKRGVAVFYLERASAEANFSRETYFINEERFTIRYMFDFSTLTTDADETIQHVTGKINDTVYAADVNTFAGGGRVGTGTAGNPFLINTTADLLALGAYVRDGNPTNGRSFLLLRDLDCTGETWVPIGTVEHPFQGTFTGGGHTISGITSAGVRANGLFGYAGSASVIQMVAVENSVFYASYGTVDGTVGGAAATSYVGALAGYSGGTIANCYSRAVVRVDDVVTGARMVGGLVGELGPDGALRGCYARPVTNINGQVADGSNTIDSANSNPGLVCGILVGKSAGLINGCYHTAIYYQPVGVGGTVTVIIPYGLVVGWFAGGSIVNTYYNSSIIPYEPSAIRYLYLKYGDSDGEYTVTASGGIQTGVRVTETNNRFAKTREELMQTESSATTNGVANDSMAQLLSQDMYLGTYEMTPLDTHAGLTGDYQNDGYPMLTAFDLAQYDFTSFDSANIILCMQNLGANEVQMMNALCSYNSFVFPTYGDIKARDDLKTQVFTLPRNITYNLSAVGYGLNDTGAIKWTVVNGLYTHQNALDVHQTDEEDNVTAYAYGTPYDTRTTDGTFTVRFGNTDALPTACNKMYVYLTLKPAVVDPNMWGVYHEWDSSTLQELPNEELEETGE